MENPNRKRALLQTILNPKILAPLLIKVKYFSHLAAGVAVELPLGGVVGVLGPLAAALLVLRLLHNVLDNGPRDYLKYCKYDVVSSILVGM